MEYYRQHHMPFMAKLLGKNLNHYEINKGLSGRTPSDRVIYVAMVAFYCYNLADYNEVIARNRTAIISDIQKYTTIQPVIQISEIVTVSKGL